MEYAVKVITPDEYWERRSSFRGPDFAERCLTAIAAGDGPCMCFLENGRQYSWECPGCGHSLTGDIGDEPVSGWENPRWVKTGPDDAPTLMPSLGCPRWRDGTCIGHWWLRDGKLVQV